MILLVLVVFLIGVVTSVPLLNNYSAWKVERKLCETPLPERTERIDSVSKAGKLTGNGNGMQYFGAMLIRSELSLEELKSYYAGYANKGWEYLVGRQKGTSVDVIEHGYLQFAENADGDNYYIVYSWGDGINSLLEEIDLRGH